MKLLGVNQRPLGRGMLRLLAAHRVLALTEAALVSEFFTSRTGLHVTQSEERKGC